MLSLSVNKKGIWAELFVLYLYQFYLKLINELKLKEKWKYNQLLVKISSKNYLLVFATSWFIYYVKVLL